MNSGQRSRCQNVAPNLISIAASFIYFLESCYFSLIIKRHASVYSDEKSYPCCVTDLQKLVEPEHRTAKVPVYKKWAKNNLTPKLFIADKGQRVLDPNMKKKGHCNTNDISQRLLYTQKVP